MPVTARLLGRTPIGGIKLGMIIERPVIDKDDRDNANKYLQRPVQTCMMVVLITLLQLNSNMGQFAIQSLRWYTQISPSATPSRDSASTPASVEKELSEDMFARCGVNVQGVSCDLVQ